MCTMALRPFIILMSNVFYPGGSIDVDREQCDKAVASGGCSSSCTIN